MYPAQFEYHTPGTVREALDLLGRHKDDAKLLAGGHSLLPAMKLRLAQPKHLVDLRKVSGLSGIKEDGGSLVIGAMTTHYQVESSPVVKSKCPMLAAVAAQIGDPMVRNMGTIGGSLAHADPAADYPAAIIALGAEMVAEGPKGKRTIKADDFFKGLLTTALAEDEILTEVRVPVMAGKTGAAYMKFPHPASRFAVVGVAAVLAPRRCAPRAWRPRSPARRPTRRPSRRRPRRRPRAWTSRPICRARSSTRATWSGSSPSGRWRRPPRP
jgi:aerobic carbon-monoxide dehydrogenase medium subunit